jgi:steroid 5-alpha reductase family enzyme
MTETGHSSMFLEIFLTAGLMILGLMSVLWLVSLVLRNASIVDIFWGPGLIIVTWVAFRLAPGYQPRKELVAALITIWGLRLAIHICLRNWSKPEDFRYARWRDENGVHWWWLSFFQVFLLQGLLMWIMSAPLLAAQVSGFPAILTPLEVLGTSIWTFGLLFESIADFQLTRFRANPADRGKLFMDGLWKFTRHPNYFGEAVVWWGFYIIALAAGNAWTIFSPILITYLLLHVSGVALLEKTMQSKPGYEEYRQRTNAFFPWFPRS